jgi:hypothetical protein
VWPSEGRGSMPWYDAIVAFIDHWQSLIAGSFGILLFAAVLWQTHVTRVEAEKQVASVVDQTKELKRQNLDLQNENRRHVILERLNALILLVAAVKQMENDITAVDLNLEDPNPITQLVGDIYKPSLDVVWNSLGICRTEIVEKYLKLDSELIRFAKADALGSAYKLKH